MIKYYLTFTDYDNKTFASDGSPLYQVNDVNFSSLQTLNIGSQSSGADAGKITFNPLTFTLATDKLTEQLDQVMASGTAFAQVNLIGYDTDANGDPVQVLRDVFKLAAVKSDNINDANGLHSFSMEYGGLVESVTPLTTAGTPGKTVTKGWNRVKNIADNSLTSNADVSGNTTLPPLDLSKAIALPDASKTDDLYVHFTGYNGAAIADDEWIRVDSADLSFLQTLNIGSQSTGAGAGKITFNPLNLTFAPGSLEPTLLQMEASGTPVKQMDVAAYGPTGALAVDYRFGLAAIKTNDDSVVNGVPTEKYSFEYGDEQIATFAPNSTTPTGVQGWNWVKNISDTTFVPNLVPATEADVEKKLAPLGTTATDHTKYYLTFTDYQNKTFNSDGSPLYQVTNVDLSSLQTLNIGSQSSGAGAGKITFNPLTFTLATDKLTEQLDQVMASGTAFAQVNLIGYDTDANNNQVQVLRDVFKLAAVKSDSIDAVTGLHDLSMEYGGLVESVTPLTAKQTSGVTVTKGWNRVKNIADNSLTSNVDVGDDTTLPPLDLSKAIAPPDPSKTNDLYVHFTGYTGATIADDEWIKVDSADLSLLQTLNIGSQSTGAGAGKITFNPLNLTFAPGSLEPTLLQMEASGTPFKQMDVAAYGPTGALTVDYRFGLAAIKSNDNSVVNGVPTETYSLEYGDEQIATFAPGAATPTDVQGWNRVKNISDTTFVPNLVPSTEADVKTKLAPVGTTATDQTKYYLEFTDYQNKPFNSDGSPLYQINNLSLSSLQTLNIGSQDSGAGAGKITFNPLTFTLASNKLTEQLDQDLASGTPFAQVNLFAYDPGKNNAPVQVQRDVFKLAAVKSDTIDAVTGLHNLSMEYGGLVESTTALTPTGVAGTAVTKGWNRVQNVADNSLTSNIDGGTSDLPALALNNAIALPNAADTKDVYVHFTGYDGAVIADDKWIKLDSADFSFLQTLNIGSQSAGSGAGKVTFNPLSLNFAPGSLEPTLLQMEASGTAIKQLDIAAYAPIGGALVENFRFGLAAIKTNDDAITHGVLSNNYTLEFGDEQIATFAPGSSTPTATQGWDRVKNVSVSGYMLDAVPKTEAELLNAACYCAGVRLLTDHGEVAVEALEVGDLVVTASGALRPIVWLGHRRIDISRHPDPAAVRPVRVSAGAFGEGLPRRDLWLSPGHNVACEDALMPISCLINGHSIVQIEQDRVEYWHVELDAHDVVLAEGLPAKSYLDCGNRTAFANGGAFVEAHPDFQPRRPVDTCLPLVKDGPSVVKTKARLLARLAERGHRLDQGADAHIVVDGWRVEPAHLSESRLAFVLPAGGREIALRSNVFVPAHALASSTDTRELGLCISGLQIDGSALALDSPCAKGWLDSEFAGGRFTHRWTSGSTPLPAGARIVIVDLAGVGHYWRQLEGEVVARVG